MFGRHPSPPPTASQTAHSDTPELQASRATGPVLVTVVESPACHFCADAHAALAELANDYPLTVETVDVRSPDGSALMQRHRATMSPLVLIDGSYFSHGRLPRKKLRALLGRRDRHGGPAPVNAKEQREDHRG